MKIKQLVIFAFFILTSCYSNKEIIVKNLYLYDDSNNKYVNIGKIYKYRNKLKFKKLNYLKIGDKSKLDINSFDRFIKNTNEQGYISIQSAPPRDYNYSTYKDKDGNERLDSKGGLWSRIVRINDKNFLRDFDDYIQLNYQMKIE